MSGGGWSSAPDEAVTRSPGADPVGGIPQDAARRIRLLVLDVDGVLTDAGVYLGAGPDGERVELKRFDIQDGLGLVLLREAGIRTAIVSGRVSAATELRARELGIKECHQEPGARKLPVVKGIVERMGLDWDDVAMVGDDLPDIPVLERVGLPLAVANAVDEVRSVAAWTTRRPGGQGAVRELCDALLEARGEREATVNGYLDARRGMP